MKESRSDMRTFSFCRRRRTKDEEEERRGEDRGDRGEIEKEKGKKERVNLVAVEDRGNENFPWKNFEFLSFYRDIGGGWKEGRRNKDERASGEESGEEKREITKVGAELAADVPDIKQDPCCRRFSSY